MLGNRSHRAFLLHIVLPLAVGSALYVLWRPTNLLVFRWLDAAGLLSVSYAARSVVGVWPGVLPEWILYSLPDGLWIYAFTSWMSSIWKGAGGLSAIAWIYSGMVLGIGSELGQGLGLVPGTFELNDLLCYGLGFLLARHAWKGN
ncbi:hypothetical protein JYT15_00315 [Acidimicrobium ferrooxidans]|nr:hypothetical protein [Acidimicrobium ferrooxidans]